MLIMTVLCLENNWFLKFQMFFPIVIYFIEYYIKNKLNKVNEITIGNTCLLLIKPFYTLYFIQMPI